MNSRHSSCLSTSLQVLGLQGELTVPAGTAIFSKLSVRQKSTRRATGGGCHRKAELSAGPASRRFKGPEGSPACSRPAERTLTGQRHSPDSVCGRPSRHTGTRTRPATQQPFEYLWGSHGPALVTSVIQTARQWRDRTAGTSLGPAPHGPPGRPRLDKPPPTSSPAQAQPRPHARTHARTRSLAQRAIIPLNCRGLVLSHLLCSVMFAAVKPGSGSEPEGDCVGSAKDLTQEVQFTYYTLTPRQLRFSLFIHLFCTSQSPRFPDNP